MSSQQMDDGWTSEGWTAYCWYCDLRKDLHLNGEICLFSPTRFKPIVFRSKKQEIAFQMWDPHWRNVA